jgi:hypothetical protein
MPRISTDNYDTVASWNGSQDLFVVEQPDGTKVATPAMVKQFMEAGDFTATGEVEDGHGNVLSGVVNKINEKCDVISLGTISATSITEALGKAWDRLTVYQRPVLVMFGWSGQIMAMMYKYPDSQYGMAIAMKYISTDIYTMSVVGGTKSYATK